MDRNVADLAYAAGIIDGEGCIYLSVNWVRPNGKIRYRHLSPRLEVACASLCLIEWLLRKFGGNFGAGKRPNRKPYYKWSLASNEAETFLRAVYPYLVIKRDQADVLFRFRSTMTKGGGRRLSDNVIALREDCYRELQRIKRAI